MKSQLALLLLTSPASAEKLRMHRLLSDNVHLANGDGAINSRKNITVTLELGAKQHVDLVSTGSNNEHNMWREGRNIDEGAMWTTTWSGVWAIKGDVLALDLGVVKDDCKGTCTAAKPRAKLTCTAETIEVGDPKSRKADAWSCSSNELGETPSFVIDVHAETHETYRCTKHELESLNVFEHSRKDSVQCTAIEPAGWRRSSSIAIQIYDAHLCMHGTPVLTKIWHHADVGEDWRSLFAEDRAAAIAWIQATSPQLFPL